MENKNTDTSRFFKWWKIAIPIVLGLGVVLYFVLRDFNQLTFLYSNLRNTPYYF